MKIAILDRIDEFPRLEEFIKINLSGYELVFVDDKISSSLQELADTYYELTGETLPVYSGDPDKVNKVLNTINNVHPYFITIDKGEFKEIYEDFRDSNPELFVPKILISNSKEVDLLEVSNLFNKSDIQKLKYTNGNADPIIIDYRGIDTFQYINTLESGVLVPATKYDDTSDMSSRIRDNKKYILQKFEDEGVFKCISYSVRSNETYGIVWSDIKEEEIPELRNRLNLPGDLACNLYLEIEVHLNNFYINKVIQGIHPFITFKSNKTYG